MGNSDSSNPLGKGDNNIYVYFHFEKLIEKCYDPNTNPTRTEDKRKSVASGNDNKLVEDAQLNSDLLACTLEEI